MTLIVVLAGLFMTGFSLVNFIQFFSNDNRN